MAGGGTPSWQLVHADGTTDGDRMLRTGDLARFDALVEHAAASTRSLRGRPRDGSRERKRKRSGGDDNQRFLQQRLAYGQRCSTNFSQRWEVPPHALRVFRGAPSLSQASRGTVCCSRGAAKP